MILDVKQASNLLFIIYLTLDPSKVIIILTDWVHAKKKSHSVTELTYTKKQAFQVAAQTEHMQPTERPRNTGPRLSLQSRNEQRASLKI